MSHFDGAEAVLTFGLPLAGIAAPIYHGDASHGATAEIARWLHEHVPVSTTSTALAFAGEQSEGENAIVQQVIGHYRTAEIHLNTARINTVVTGAHWLRNVARSPAWACQHGSPFAGQTVFVVGAGAALNDLADLLPAMARKGHMVCPNSALGALLRAGVTPDAVFYSEHRDQSDNLRGYSGATVLECSASPAVWDVATHPLAASREDMDLMRYMSRIPAAPLRYAVSACCGAIAQAFAWGAREVVLAGTSYCVFDDGIVYAAGSPFDDLRERIGEDGVTHTEGTSKRVDPSEFRMVPGIGGGEVACPLRLAAEVEWIERCGGRVPMRNVNRRGVVIGNVPSVDLGELLATLPDLGERYDFTRPAPRVDTGPVVDDIVADLRAFLAAPTHDPRPGLLRFFARYVAFLQRLTADEAERRAMLVQAQTDGATAALEALTVEEHRDRHRRAGPRQRVVSRA